MAPNNHNRTNNSIVKPSPSRAVTETTSLLTSQNIPRREDSIRWRETASFLLPYVIPDTCIYRFLAVFSVFSVLLSKACDLLPPFAYKLIVDTLTDNVTLDVEKRLVPYLALALYVGGTAAARFLIIVKDYCYNLVAARCTRRFSVAVFSHLQTLSLAFHLQRKTGEITRIMDRGVLQIDTLATTIVFTLFPT